eukprot:6206290-Pleurochrysis_carterae.AAC.3
MLSSRTAHAPTSSPSVYSPLPSLVSLLAAHSHTCQVPDLFLAPAFVEQLCVRSATCCDNVATATTTATTPASAVVTATANAAATFTTAAATFTTANDTATANIAFAIPAPVVAGITLASYVTGSTGKGVQVLRRRQESTGRARALPQGARPHAARSLRLPHARLHTRP